METKNEETDATNEEVKFLQMETFVRFVVVILTITRIMHHKTSKIGNWYTLHH